MERRLASMTELSEIISSRTRLISDFLAQQEKTPPTLGTENAGDYLPPDNKELQQARLELRDATHQLHLLSAGTDQALFELCMTTQHDANIMRVIYVYQIAQHVPLQGDISYEELSQKCGLEPRRLKRVLGYAMTTFVFRETKEGRVAHTSLSRAIATDGLSNDWVGHITDDMFPMAGRMADAFRKWPGSDAPTHTGFHLMYDTQMSLFEWFEAEDSTKVSRFGKAMAFYSRLHEREILGFDWAALGPAVLVDVGGGYGHKAASIARTAPEMRFIVQDLEATIKSAPPLSDELRDRFTFEVYDFFTPQPQRTADVFLFASVFHDWNDESCIRILSNLVPSMKAGARLVINDAIILPPNEGSTTDQRGRRSIDVHMMVALNAKERSLDEWEQLVKKGSDGKLVLESASGGGLLSFIRA